MGTGSGLSLGPIWGYHLYVEKAKVYGTHVGPLFLNPHNLWRAHILNSHMNTLFLPSYSAAGFTALKRETNWFWELVYAQSHLAAVNLWQERVGIHYHAGCLWPGSGHVCDLAGFNCARPPIRFRGARERQPSNPVHLHALLCSYRQRLTTSSGQCCNCTQDGAWTLWPSGRAAVARRKSCVLAWRLLVRSRDY
jgi:hypothetical protein